MNSGKLKIHISHPDEGTIRHKLTVNPSELYLDEESEFGNPIYLDVSVDKVGRTISINVNVDTLCRMACDRCLEPFDYLLKENVKIMLSTDSQFQDEEDDNIGYISESENEVDLTDPIHETLLLALPQKRLCQENCQGLCPQCGKNLNQESCQCQEQKIDPRWEKLRNLLKDNDN